MRLYLIAAPAGIPVIWGLANAKIGACEVTQALPDRDFETFITENFGAQLIHPDHKVETPRFSAVGGT